MIAYYSPGSSEPETHTLRDGTVVVGRKSRRGVERYVSVSAGGGRCSRRHGAFTLDSRGAVRYVDLRSKHGSMLFPARGMPRRIPARRPVVLHPGDGVGFGGALPKQLTLAHALAKMHIFRVTEVPERAEDDEEREHAVIEPHACVVCQETMLAPRVLCCGHTFCDDCISRWFRDKARTFPRSLTSH